MDEALEHAALGKEVVAGRMALEAEMQVLEGQWNVVDSEVAPTQIREKTRLRLRRTTYAFEVEVCYDFTKSTQANYSAVLGEAVGPYQSIRERLDLEYHGQYVARRQSLQDQFIADAVSTGRPSRCPWLIFTAGPMGAGKSHVIQHMHEAGHFVLDTLVHCDPDLFKAALPEWPGYVKRDRLNAGMLCHRESCMLVEIAMEVALHGRMNCWVDGSLKDGVWYRKVIEDVTERYPHYQVAIIEVQATPSVIFQRIAKRAAETGRDIPQEDVLDSIERVPRSVEALCPLVQFYACVDNSSSDGGAPKLTKFCDQEICYVMSSEDDVANGWSEIRRRFGAEKRSVSQSVAHVGVESGWGVAAARKAKL
jgi:hypothetical protein